MADETRSTSAQTDHDLLIRLDTKMDRSADDIKSLGHRIEEVKHDLGVMADGLELKIASAVSGKADTTRMMEIKAEHDLTIADHETRLRRVERWGFTAIGALAIIQLVISIVK